MPREKVQLKKTHDYASSKEVKLAVIFIHGIASDSSTFDHALKYLEGLKALEDVRFITFDLLGSGKSPKSDEFNYDYNDQLEALQNSIEELELDVPLVLVGHSLGTFIVTRYAFVYNTVRKIILISPPVYTAEDLDNPAFETGMKVFKEAVSLKNHKILKEKAFINSMDKIVLDKKNYGVLSNLKTPAVLIYGDKDQFIGIYNMARMLKSNPDYLRGIKTDGRHGVSKDKYKLLAEILKEELNAQIV